MLTFETANSKAHWNIPREYISRKGAGNVQIRGCKIDCSRGANLGPIKLQL